MHQITSSQFKAAVKLDPAWASKLTESVEITDYCNMVESEISHLSSLLHFSGKNEDGNSASFSFCKSLKVAEGKFEGWVCFYDSAIEKIGALTCGKNRDGDSACFRSCKSLKVAEGKFEGAVGLRNSGIEKIGDLFCGKNDNDIRLDVKACPNLRSIPFIFNPKEVIADRELLKELTETRAFIQKKRSEIVKIEL